MYGIKDVKENDSARIEKFITENNYSKYTNMVLQKPYSKFIRDKFQNDSTLIRYYLQPIQALYYNTKDSLISYHVNCNAGGFPNLKWDRNGYFNSYPPKTQTVVDENFVLSDIIPFLKDFKTSNQPTIKEGSNSRIIVIYSLMMERQSKNLIDFIVSNYSVAKETPDLYLVNIDNLYAE